MKKVHPDFISLESLCSNMIIQASYGTSDNFTGEVVDGYKNPKAYLARLPALSLLEAQKKALEIGLTLKIFDGYRPVKAVQFFQDWAQRPETNPATKSIYYPKFSRGELFLEGYISTKSSHSRGSAVDLTLADLCSGNELDMGSCFDYFDEISNTESLLVSDLQARNRRLLKHLMEEQGFKNFSKEWWHYSFRNEPFPESYFDFDVE